MQYTPVMSIRILQFLQIKPLLQYVQEGFVCYNSRLGCPVCPHLFGYDYAYNVSWWWCRLLCRINTIPFCYRPEAFVGAYWTVTCIRPGPNIAISRLLWKRCIRRLWHFQVQFLTFWLDIFASLVDGNLLYPRKCCGHYSYMHCVI